MDAADSAETCTALIAPRAFTSQAVVLTPVAVSFAHKQSFDIASDVHNAVPVNCVSGLHRHRRE